MSKKIFSWINPKLKVKEITGDYKGVFTDVNIKKDEVLAIFGGYILSHDEEDSLDLKYRDGGIQIHDNFVISSADHEESTDFFNHSCEPNSGIRGQILLVSMRDINMNEEITFDYAMCLSFEDYSFECRCGNESCRKIVTGIDWKNKDLQRKYEGYFSEFLIKKIRESN